MIAPGEKACDTSNFLAVSRVRISNRIVTIQSASVAFRRFIRSNFPPSRRIPLREATSVKKFKKSLPKFLASNKPLGQLHTQSVDVLVAFR
jgi:hypothetical protein